MITCGFSPTFLDTKMAFHPSPQLPALRAVLRCRIASAQGGIQKKLGLKNGDMGIIGDISGGFHKLLIYGETNPQNRWLTLENP